MLGVSESSGYYNDLNKLEMVRSTSERSSDSVHSTHKSSTQKVWKGKI